MSLARGVRGLNVSTNALLIVGFEGVAFRLGAVLWNPICSSCGVMIELWTRQHHSQCEYIA